ncbi:TetR/AcrR family transcriptional regulator [Labilibaculum sp. DW002]|uniref:TetR/AcrR family transcriptional regulator n=1 Tax=Paralabilibaculum antarcticum TaxID=2912572 RepID=A0ABT5VQZ7_9BACT|nr:TetR/AcrR family transcriptional regulator [Labilibaculum sp. DW002]MDE5417843.1 TetR/AcrR family transcriptional regulator [Labilibaculum sp. DW002]
MAKSDKAEIQEKVTKIAMDMMLKFGLRGLNMVELARECGLAKATLYKIIGSKEDLVTEIALEIFRINIVAVLDPMMKHDDPVIATKQFLDKYFDYAIESQKILINQIYKEYPLIEKDVESNYNEMIVNIQHRFKTWQDKKLIRTDIEVDYILEALEALNEFYVRSDYSNEEIIRRMRAAFISVFRGIGIPL